MSVVNAGIAWAMPVKPDMLGEALEAYEKNLPILYALHLCHRFGRGKDVHITKLPAEILIAIEDNVLDCEQHMRQSQWAINFCHYESRCEPIDHLDETSSLYADILDASFDELCDACRDEDCDSNCEACNEIVKANVNEHLSEYGEWRYEYCYEKRQEWEKLIDQKPGGQFVKYDEVRLTLLKHQQFRSSTQVEHFVHNFSCTLRICSCMVVDVATDPAQALWLGSIFCIHTPCFFGQGVTMARPSKSRLP